jgi:predicted hydrocarbon binding protein
MKGAIFTGFAEYVEKEYDLTTWLKTLDSCELASNGEYLATELYDDAEFKQLADTLSTIIEVRREQIYRGFGEYFFPTLMSLGISLVKDIDNLFDFMRAVDSVIHIEVQKSDPLAYTPTLLYDQPQERVLIVRYLSHRKMCHFAEGLILGAAAHFHQKVSLSQTKCMCEGDEHCLIRVEV